LKKTASTGLLVLLPYNLFGRVIFMWSAGYKYSPASLLSLYGNVELMKVNVSALPYSDDWKNPQRVNCDANFNMDAHNEHPPEFHRSP